MSLIRSLGSQIPRPVLLRIKYLKQFVYRKANGKEKVKSSFPIATIAKDKTHVFFGYYDVSPFNCYTDDIVYLNLRKGNNFVDIMRSNLNDLTKETIIAKSYAWNWQQGIRLRWMPGSAHEICYNDFKENQYIARIFDVDAKTESIIDYPLYDISNDGKNGLSINFERLGVMRPGYGYTCRPYTQGNNLSKEGVDLINLQTGIAERLFTYADIASVYKESKNDYSNNYLNHISFSPSGKRFLFFWLTARKGLHRADLLVYDFSKGSLKILENSEIVSHYVWMDDNHILCTALKSPIECHYYIYDILDGTKTIVNPTLLHEDGHPSMLTEGTIITDTYPDLNGFQKLFVSNLKEGGYKLLVEIYSNCLVEGERRTDLHPRLNHSKNMVCFDSNHELYRTLNFLKF